MLTTSRSDPRGLRWPLVVIVFGLLASTALLGQGAARGADPVRQLMDARPDRGQNVAPVFEGWQRNADGTFDLYFGYLNRNWSESLDIPVGADNSFDPGPPDRGQPTHFLARRHKQIFKVTVPADFGKQTLVWTLSVRGNAERVPGSLRPEQQIDVTKDSSSGNTPPKVEIAAAGTAMAGVPYKLTASVIDDGLPKTRASAENVRLGPNVIWSKYRGPGSLRFAPDVTAVQAQTAATTVVFSEPGEYMIQALADDGSVVATAQGQSTPGFACCWSTTRVKVTVTGTGTTGR